MTLCADRPNAGKMAELNRGSLALFDLHDHASTSDPVCDHLARHPGMAPGTALPTTANLKFERRFRTLRERLDRQHRVPKVCSLTKLEGTWAGTPKFALVSIFCTFRIAG